MDEATFSDGQALWVNELKPNRAEELRNLTRSEIDMYAGLREHRWGTNLRLEQERLAWPVCLRALREALCEGQDDEALESGATVFEQRRA